MENFKIFATLVAVSALSKRGFSLPHNRNRCVPPKVQDAPLDSRENTPFTAPDSEDDEDHEWRLNLSLNHPPMDIRRGFVFGWGPNADIQLVDRENMHPGDRSMLGSVSRMHFSITFDAEHRVVLVDTSMFGTSLAYDDQCDNEIRSGFTWIIFPDWERIYIDLPDSEFAFRIILSEYGKSEEFRHDLATILQPVLTGTGLASPMAWLNLHSRSASGPSSRPGHLETGPIYVRQNLIGEGGFGAVYKVLDVSTGEAYAGKTLHRVQWEREYEALQALQAVDHERIVRFLGLHGTHPPQFIMEYLPLGDLTKHQGLCSFKNLITILEQGLQGLEHMHARKFIHRDIKPGNILISSVNPLAIKIADFGLSNRDRDGRGQFESYVGTPCYAAPEIHDKTPYSYPADVWSLGMVVLVVGFNYKGPRTREWDMAGWFQHLKAFLPKLDRSGRSNGLAAFLTRSMLQFNPAHRESASKCLQRLSGIKEGLLKSATQSAPVSLAELHYPLAKDPVYLSVLTWLEGMRRRKEVPGPRIAQIESLCNRLQQLDIDDIEFCVIGGQIAVTAVRERKEFPFAVLIPSDLSGPIADLAAHLRHKLSTEVPDP